MAGDRVLPPSERPHGPVRRRRLVWSAALVSGAVLGATLMVPSYGDDSASSDRSGSLVDRYEKAVADAQTAEPSTSTGGETVGEDGHAHDHSDPSTKNAVSRSDATGPEAQDPTTNAEKLAGISAVAKQRTEPQPELVPVAKRPDRRDVPEDRYAMAGGCYALQAGSGKWVARSADGFAASKAKLAGGGAVPLPGHRPRQVPPVRQHRGLRRPGQHPAARRRGGRVGHRRERVGRLDGPARRVGVHLHPEVQRRQPRRRRRRHPRPRRDPREVPAAHRHRAARSGPRST